MTYQVLARKWRPQDFSGVIGQEPIVKALRNALTDGRIAQAYLFSGIRGVGKTSVARLFAKALNCEQGPTPDPCNECVPCREITSGADLDVLEIDAATYSKVEQVRELTESLRYGPARDRYKVVVLDEVHRLSRQAFDALLKIVEEPPDHLVFLFATTEIDAVPATILSRCQEFHFRRVSTAQLAAHLRMICDAEEIEAGEAALRLVARAGEGSVRDAVALLDQLATFGSGKIPDQEAARILGGLAAALQQQLLTAIVAGDRQGISDVVREIEDEGWDPRQAFADFLGYCRNALHLAVGGEIERADLPQEDAEALAALARQAGFENLLRLIHQQLDSESTVRRSDSGTLALEIAWLRGGELPKLTRIEELLSGTAPPGNTSPPPARGGGRKAASKRPEPAPRAAPVPVEPESSPEASADPVSSDVAPTAASLSGSANDQDRIRSFLEQLSRRKQLLAAHMAEAERLSFSEGELQIYTLPGDPWLRSALEREANRSALEACLSAVWGEGTAWRLREQTAERATLVEVPTNSLLEHPTVQAALDIFGGTAEAIDNDGS